MASSRIRGFREYLKFGFVSTVLVLAAGVPILWLTCGSALQPPPPGPAHSLRQPAVDVAVW